MFYKGDGIVTDGGGEENEAIDLYMSKEKVIFGDKITEKEVGARNENHLNRGRIDAGKNDVRKADCNHES